MSGERDADQHSALLQEYHRVLWSKALPNGLLFELKKRPSGILCYESKVGEILLSSDRAVPTFTHWKKPPPVVLQISKVELSRFNHLTETIGSMMIWPSKRVNRNITINAARGWNKYIKDRLDFTIECIRRYYLGEYSPLFGTLKRYDSFFNLFENFKGYVNFFLLQDAVFPDYESVNIATPFDNFKSTPVPATIDEYSAYMRDTMRFIDARNKRIAEYAKQFLELL